jgi:hypothetical protein
MEYLLGLLIAIPLLFLYSAFSWGYVLSCLYTWFVLSAAPTLPHFTIVQFIGFSIFANAFIRHQPVHIKDEYKDTKSVWTNTLLEPWVILFFAWAFHAIFL